MFENELETQLAARVPFVPSRVEIGTEQVAQQFVSLFFHSLDALLHSHAANVNPRTQRTGKPFAR